MRRRTWFAAISAMLAWTIVIAAAAQPVFDIRLTAERISFDELARLFPPLRDIDLPPALRVTRFEAQGPLDHVKVSFAAESAAGHVSGSVVLDVRAPQRWARGSVQLRGVELARLLDRPALPEKLTAEVTFDLKLPNEAMTPVHGSFTLTSPAATLAGYAARAIRVSGRIDGRRVSISDGRASAYGAQVRTTGQLVLDDLLQYDLKGSAAGVSLNRLPQSLPVPRVESDLTFEYQIAGTGSDASGQVVFAPSAIAGARIARPTTATFDTRGESFDYHATGQVADLDLARVGDVFAIEALQGSRFASAIDGRFDITSRGGSVRSLTFDVADAAIFGGRIPQLSATLTPVDLGLHLAAHGRFTNLDPGATLEQPALDGDLTGTLDLTGTIPRKGGALQVAAMDLQGRVTLDSSSFEGTPIDTGIIVAALTAGSRLEIERAELMSADATLRVSGVYGVDPAVPTSLRYHVATPALAAFADLVSAPVQGDITLEGTVTGHEVLHATGTMSAALLESQGVSARALSGRYEAAVPRGDFAALVVKAHLETAALAVAGQTFNSVIADVTYDQSRLTFDVDAEQAQRSIGAAGALVWHPDHQELHLARLGLRTGDTEWHLAPGATPAIEYGGDRLVVHDLRLNAAPDQSLTINGDIRAGNVPLQITAANVQLSAFAPWIGQAGVAGVLNAEAVVSGGLASPEAAVTFDVASGSFRGVPFRSVGGRVEYDPHTIDLDVRLEQPDGAWITADGQIPTALLTAGDAPIAAPMDVTFRSSPIDLAILRAFTTTLTDITGTVQVDARFQGTLTDPKLAGQVVIHNGAFAVPVLGTSYTGLDTAVLLQPDAVVVDGLRVVDDDGDWLSVSGRLPVKELAQGVVNLRVEAEGFQVIDNAFADIQADAALQVTGRLTEPIISGGVALVNSSVAVDELLDLAEDDAYPIAGVQPARSSDRPLPSEDGGTGWLSEWPVAIDVQLIVPRLLLHGDQLQGPANLPGGLGSVNVTASGGVSLTKTAAGSLRASGEIETVRGTYEFQNREFELVRGGTILFTGEREINPRVNVTARRTIAEVDTEVHLRGTLDQPRLELTSQPPLDQSDILALILFNRPVLQLGAGQQAALGLRAAALAAGFAGSQIGAALGDVLGLDVVDIDAGELADGGLAPVVTIGEQFGDFYLRYQQQVGSATTSQVVLEYDITDWFRIQSTLTNRRDAVRPLLRRLEGSGIDAVFSFEYGGPDDPEQTAGLLKARYLTLVPKH